ncbi:MAG: CHASE2 domain-containing protein [Cyanobacteria bacterium P01_G01_bin.19]
MKRHFLDKVKAEFALWRMNAIPGMAIIVIVMLARWAGLLQALEIGTLDRFLRWRIAEPTDDRILIVGINEADISSVGTYPIPDRELAILIEKLSAHNPAAIGIDIFRDLPVEPGHDRLTKALRQHQNIFGVEKVLPEKIAPPPSLSPERVGFVDQVLDPNGNLRRNAIAISDDRGEFKFSFAILLAQAYLKTHGYFLANVPDDEWAMAFNSHELIRFKPNMGGYIRADAAGNQLLLNFRSGKHPFRVVSLQQIKAGKVDPNWIRDRLVLVGVTAKSIKDVINAPGIDTSPWGLVYGVEINAHAVSQIISSVLDGRPLLYSLSEAEEYLLILISGLFGIGLTRIFSSSGKIALCLSLTILSAIVISFLLLASIGLWLPIVPAFLVLLINGASLTASNFYRYQQNLKLQLQERQFIIDYTFDTIHNGPLQTLKQILRETQQESFQHDLVRNKLILLEQELRTVYQSVRQETIIDGEIIYIDNTKIDLNDPIKEILYQVYASTIERNFPCFKTLKYQIVKFEDIDSQQLTVEQKRNLCRFLEEALCNVGKHALGLTRLKVSCVRDKNANIVRVEDNGIGIANSSNQAANRGRGTKQALNLAKQLNGQFKRYAKSSSGTICELSWLSSET